MKLSAGQLKEIIESEVSQVLEEKRKRVSVKGRKDMSRAQKKLVEEVSYKGKRARATNGILSMLGFRQRGNGSWSGPSKRLAMERNFSKALDRLKDAEGIRNAASLLMDAKIVGLSLINKLNWMHENGS
jgi:hypothetical protein